MFKNNRSFEGIIVLIIGITISTVLFFIFQKSAEKEEKNKSK
jgi:uncharacterized membrane protein YdjX (TVP38/TMEM64 family)